MFSNLKKLFLPSPNNEDIYSQTVETENVYPIGTAPGYNERLISEGYSRPTVNPLRQYMRSIVIPGTYASEGVPTPAMLGLQKVFISPLDIHLSMNLAPQGPGLARTGFYIETVPGAKAQYFGVVNDGGD